MIVRFTYDDGKTEEHELKNGIHFAITFTALMCGIAVCVCAPWAATDPLFRGKSEARRDDQDS